MFNKDNEVKKIGKNFKKEYALDKKTKKIRRNEMQF